MSPETSMTKDAISPAASESASLRARNVIVVCGDEGSYVTSQDLPPLASGVPTDVTVKPTGSVMTAQPRADDESPSAIAMTTDVVTSALKEVGDAATPQVLTGAGVGVGVGVTVGTGESDGVAVGVGESIGLAVGVGVAVGESVGVDVGTGESVGVGESVGESDGLAVGESVGAGVGEVLGVAVGESL